MVNLMKVVEKVTAFVTRETANGRQLLVFHHPLNGVQLPAGTVELGESPEVAVMREAREETGLAGLRLVRPLGMLERTLADGHFLLHRTTKLFDMPAADASIASQFVLNRGSYVHLLQEQDDYAEVLCEDIDYNADPPRPFRQEQGWVRRSLLTPHIHRYQYWLACDFETADNWPVAVDGHIFNLFWAPLQPAPAIAPAIAPALVWPQDEWLAAVSSTLLAEI
jgi:8-oxo-dGTP pyrophosphatase MutT (NUDIX family)